MPLQTCPNVTLTYVGKLGECCLSGSDISLNLLVLVFISGAVYLSQIDVTCTVLYLSVVNIYWCVLFIIILVFDLFIYRPSILLSSANSCSICCSSCGVLVHKGMPMQSVILHFRHSIIFSAFLLQLVYDVDVVCR